jgi:ABC-type oligopeptide transport system ATPase subunit
LSEAILQVKELKKYFPIQKGIFRRTIGHMKAVDGVSFELKHGEALGIVGESGSGKSTLIRSVLRLLEPTDGLVEYKGQNMRKMSKAHLRQIRRDIQLVFQDPYASLNPRYTVAQTVMESMVVQRVYTKKQRMERVYELLDRVGLDPSYASRYPHEFSGGQRQRIGIARALAISPKLVFLDEPVAALDVSVQAQVLNLLEDLQQELNLSYVFVAHDLSVVRYLCNRVLVMYRGKMMEMAETEELFKNPMHPYTQSLLSAVPIPDPNVPMNRTPAPEFDIDFAGDTVHSKESHWKEVSPNHFVSM